MNFKKLDQVQNVSQLYNFVIDFWVENSSMKNKVENILVYLCLTQKGLTSTEIMNIGRINEKEWNTFQIMFSCLIIRYEGIFSIKSTSFIQTLFERMKCSLNSTSANNSDFVVPYH